MAGLESNIGTMPNQNMWNREAPYESPSLAPQLPTGIMNSHVPTSNLPFPQCSEAPIAGFNAPGTNTGRTCNFQSTPQAYHYNGPHHNAQSSNTGSRPIQNLRLASGPPGPMAGTEAYNQNKSYTCHTSNHHCVCDSPAPLPPCSKCKHSKGQEEINQPATQLSPSSDMIFLNGKWFRLYSADPVVPPDLSLNPPRVVPLQSGPSYSTPSSQSNPGYVPPPMGSVPGLTQSTAPINQPTIPGVSFPSTKKVKKPGNTVSNTFIQPLSRPPGAVPRPQGGIPPPTGWNRGRRPPPMMSNIAARSSSTSSTGSGTSISSDSESSKSENSDPGTSRIETEEGSRHNPFDSSEYESSDSEDDDSSSGNSDTSSQFFPTKAQSSWHNSAKNLLPKLGDGIPENYRSSNPTIKEWERQKREFGAKNQALDQLMSMVGMEEVKAEFLRIKSTIETAQRRRGRLRWQDLNLALMGNPGTGKRTLAGIYLDFLAQCGVWSDAKKGNVPFKYLSATDLELNTLSFNLSDIMFLFIDSIDHLDEDDMPKVLDLLDRHAHKLVVVVSGTTDSITRFLGGSPRGRWQFRRRLQLKDLLDDELRLILLRLIQHNSLKVVGGDESPAPLIAAKRVGRGRKSKDFGNVYDLISAFEKILERHSSRLDEEKKRARDREIEALKSNNEMLGAIAGDHHKDIDRNLLFFNVLAILLCMLFFGRDLYPKAFTKLSIDRNSKENNVYSSKTDDQTKHKHGDPQPKIHRPNKDKKVTVPSPNDHKNMKESEHRPNTSNAAESTENKDQENDSSWLTMDDIVGKQPTDIQSQSNAWKELEKMTGLEDVKRAIKNLVNITTENHYREIHGKEPVQVSLNRVFLGPPGTGKTTVAKLYGQILGDIGLLSSNEVIIKTPGDFIGQYLGDSEANTNAILESSKGKVLIIDDAYMFYHDTGSGAHHDTDEYKIGCIDTLVSNIHNTPGEDRCVILIGYQDLMESMLQKVNPGLRRRFPLEDAFYFKDYDDEQLSGILRFKMAKEEITADGPAMDVAVEVLRRMRDRPNFGNGGDVQNLLDQAKARFRERTSKTHGRGLHDKIDTTNNASVGKSPIIQTGLTEYKSGHDQSNTIVLEKGDFDPEWDRGIWASQKCASLFQGLVGFDTIINQLQDYQRIATNMRFMGKDPRESIPFTFVFKGPPGTGKTHTARIMGQIFYDMGFLSTNEVIECSASNLIGEYLGQTGPKIKNLLDRALGKVLFVDEAYRLGGESRSAYSGKYEQEATGELVDCMTKPRYLRKIVIVLAGYDGYMDAFMEANPGLRGRFATDVAFRPMSPHHCEEHLVNLIRKEGIFIQDDPEASLEARKAVLRLLGNLSMTPGWSNARDVKTLATMITADVYRKDLPKPGDGGNAYSHFENRLKITTNDMISCLKRLLKQRNMEWGLISK